MYTELARFCNNIIMVLV